MTKPPPHSPGGKTVEPAAGPWPALRAQFHAEITQRHLSRGLAAAELGVSKASVTGWLLPDSPAPSAPNIDAIQKWLASPAAPAAQPRRGRNGAPRSIPDADDDDWPQVRDRLREVIRGNGLSYAQAGAVLEVEAATVAAWMSRPTRRPGLRIVADIRAKLSSGALLPAPAPAAPAAGPLYTLSLEERDRLAAHISLGDVHELRQRFGATSRTGRCR